MDKDILPRRGPQLLDVSTWIILWVSLDQAIAHIRTRGIPGDLALHDFQRAAREGRLCTALRQGGEETGYVTPAFWADCRLREESEFQPDGTVKRTGHIRVLPPEGKTFDAVAMYFFVLREDLDRQFPAAPAAAPVVAPSMAPTVVPALATGDRSKGSRTQEEIRQFIARQWPDGVDGVRTGLIRDLAGKDKEFTKRVFPLPHRSTFERALGRRKD
jgi:hypothetical protein